MSLNERILESIPVVKDSKFVYLAENPETKEMSGCALGGAFFMETGERRVFDLQQIARTFDIPLEFVRELGIAHATGKSRTEVAKMAKQKGF